MDKDCAWKIFVDLGQCAASIFTLYTREMLAGYLCGSVVREGGDNKAVKYMYIISHEMRSTVYNVKPLI